jgi:transposase
MPKQKNVATRPQVIAMHEHLLRVIKRLEGGMCEYLDGHSDKSVADAEGVAPSNVAGLRVEMFGKLRPAPRGDASAELDALRRDHEELVAKFNRLLQTLALNHVADRQAPVHGATQAAAMSGPHPSHVTRISDASSYDEICVNCGATDGLGTWGPAGAPVPQAREGP